MKKSFTLLATTVLALSSFIMSDGAFAKDQQKGNLDNVGKAQMESKGDKREHKELTAEQRAKIEERSVKFIAKHPELKAKLEGLSPEEKRKLIRSTIVEERSAKFIAEHPELKTKLEGMSTEEKHKFIRNAITEEHSTKFIAKHPELKDKLEGLTPKEKHKFMRDYRRDNKGTEGSNNDHGGDEE